MKKPASILPPRWATKLLSWYCKPEILEDLEGDLNEYFIRNVKDKGLVQARLIYIIDVFKFFRPYTVRRPQLLNVLIHWIMLGNYVKTSGRSILRNKLFSVINIAGLAVSMCIGLLMIAMMTDLLSYDKFHANYDRIYRVVCRYEFNGKKDHGYMATTSMKAGKLIRETFSGVDDVAIFRRDFGGDVTAGEKTIPLSGLWADHAMFNVFSFDVLAGDRATMLTKPFTVVLTEKSALKLFGHTDVLGKVITLGKGTERERDYTIAGLMKDPPAFSHVKFDILGSLPTREVTQRDNKREMAWDDVWHTWVYVLLPPGHTPDDLQANLHRLSETEDKTVPFTHIDFRVQALSEIIVGSGPDGRDVGNEIGPAMGNTILWILGSLSFVVILLAALNYTNLSVARSLRRTREIGVRKTIGAQRGHVVNQFLVEAVMISLCAVIFSFGLFLFIRPYFLGLEGSLQSLLRLELTPLLMGEFLLFAIVVGILAGIFPAFFFARVNVAQVFRNLSLKPALKGVTLRKALITFQYCVSIIGITATLILYKQYKHFVSYDLGFSTENILNISLQGNDADVLQEKISQLPEVRGVSKSTLVMSTGTIWGTLVKNPQYPLDSAGVFHNGIDENFLALHDLTTIAGRNFKAKPKGAPESEVIVNERTLKRFKIADGDPVKAIGEVLEVDRKPMTIIGVVKDFQYSKPNDGNRTEVLLRYTPQEAQYLNVKVLSGDWLQTMAKLETIWKEIDDVHEFRAQFYDDQIEEAYDGLEASVKLGSFLAFLVIVISSIGLLGMVVYSTETRLREVSIRKVFGATETALLIILSRGFVFLLLIAAAIGLPLTYLGFEKLILPMIVNHAPLGIFEMTMGVVPVLCLALLMIGIQTAKVAKTNPAETLKVE